MPVDSIKDINTFVKIEMVDRSTTIVSELVSLLRSLSNEPRYFPSIHFSFSIDKAEECVFIITAG